MTDGTTPRFALPLLSAGQAGKELTHNEALSRLDLLVQPAVEAVGLDQPPAAPVAGQCWVVGSGGSGAWAGHAGDIAGWTDGGWRFATPVEGLRGWCISSAKPITYLKGLWQEGDVRCTRLVVDGQPVVGARGAAVPEPTGGTTVDEGARAAIGAILVRLRQHGLIAG